MSLKFIITVLVLLCTVQFVQPSPQDIHIRKKEKDLSDVPHHPDSDQHDTRYDHEAFLGKEQSDEFDKLSPEESKQKLEIIIDKIDKDHNGSITRQELYDWIKFVSERYFREDRDRRWDEIGGNSAEKMDWEYYKRQTFGDDEDTLNDPEKLKTLRKIMRIDENRFRTADQNYDGQLSKEEFLAFINPEGFAYMKETVLTEKIEDLDKDNDGYVSLDEFLLELWDPASGRPKPEVYDDEKQRFVEESDHNKDGKLDREEVREMHMPKDYDAFESEAEHLFNYADLDKDNLLTKEEILDNSDLFVGSHATNHGEYLKRPHSEL